MQLPIEARACYRCGVETLHGTTLVLVSPRGGGSILLLCTNCVTELRNWLDKTSQSVNETPHN